ncbi:MAG: glycosyltransferase [Myxococcales bacterium]|nr:glycosyltransferase [Myxococcales bacterium]
MPDRRLIRLVEFTKAFFIGGTEGQVLELLRGLPADYRIKVAVLYALGPLLDEVRRAGFEPQAFPLRGSFASPSALLQIARLAAWLRAERIDLVHVHDFYSTLLAVPAARLARVKVVVGRLDLLHWHGRLRAAALAQLTRLADQVVVNAEAVRRLCLAEGIRPERIALIRNGIDLQRFDRQARVPLLAPLPDPRGAPVVVHLANMSHPVKRQEDLLQALRIASESVGPICAYFVGGGARRPGLEKLARQLGLGGRAHFLGFRRDTPAILARASLGVLCSSREGLSNAVIEGMAARLPMVVTDVGGNRELVEHGERGLVVEPHRPEQLAEAIGTLIADPAAARRLANNARRFVERELTVDRLIARHDQLYRKVLGRDEAVISSPAAC